MIASLYGYTIVAMILFSIGIIGVISRRNIFIMYMSIELILNAVNLLFVTFSRYHNNLDSQVITIIIIAIAAAEAAIFLAAIILLFRTEKSLDADLFNFLKQGGTKK